MTKTYTHSKVAPKTSLDEKQPVGQNQVSSLKLKDLQNQDSGIKTGTAMTKKMKRMMIVACVLAIVAGTGTGVGAFKLRNQAGGGKTTQIEMGQRVAGGKINNGDIFGVKDESIFGDNKAEGYLEKGGIDGEGSHKLLRPGGPSQTVYLTSSTTDLDQFIGMDVKVAGETFKAQKAGWLMDVGRVEVVNNESEAPVEEE